MPNFMSNVKDKMPNKKPNQSKPKTSKPKNPKKRKLDIWNKLAIGVLSVFLIGCISVFFILVNIVNDPTGLRFSKDGLVTTANTRIFAGDGKLEMEMGSEIREDITYDKLPQSVIDAFLSIEDSRFFDHNGFDLPRFMAAGLANLRQGGFAQGGSTLTMQMIDNSFTKKKEAKLEEAGTYTTSEKLKLKVQEIYLSLIAEQSIDKETIFENYVNKIWFGSGGNTRGIQKAANYYFNKDVSQLNIGESAFLAGSINAPDYYNPINNMTREKSVMYVEDGMDYLANATERRNTTLALMKQHGYITEEEYNLYVNTDLAFAIDYQEQKSSNPYAAFMDQVISEAITITGQDPTVVPMDIYTTLDKDLQNQANAIINGEIIPYPDEAFDIGFAVVDNDTGEVLAVGPGRGYDASSEERKDNSIERRSPGSTMKPLLAYSAAFDELGWSTVHTVNDKKEDYLHNGIPTSNSDGVYQGQMSLQDALGLSKNTTALASMIELINHTGNDYWIQFCKNLGYTDYVAEHFIEQYTIGGGDMQASPREQASAYTIFANGGKRIEDHTVRKIVYRSDNTEITPDLEPKRVISEQAAWMMSQLLYKVVNGGYNNLNNILATSAYPLYGKSGTSDWEGNGIAYGIPQAAIRDEWSVGYSSQYTVACWSGYLNHYEQQGWYIPTHMIMNYTMAFYVTDYLLDYLSNREQYVDIPRPDGITDYKGGFIKNEFAAQGDNTSIKKEKSEEQEACEADGGQWIDGKCKTKEEIDKESEDKANQDACTSSGGTWENGACGNCPSGTKPEGNACVALSPEELCAQQPGMTWNGSACVPVPVDPPVDPVPPVDPDGGGDTGGQTPTPENNDNNRAPAIVFFDPRRLLQSLLQPF